MLQLVLLAFHAPLNYAANSSCRQNRATNLSWIVSLQKMCVQIHAAHIIIRLFMAFVFNIHQLSSCTDFHAKTFHSVNILTVAALFKLSKKSFEKSVIVKITIAIAIINWWTLTQCKCIVHVCMFVCVCVYPLYSNVQLYNLYYVCCMPYVYLRVYRVTYRIFRKLAKYPSAC